MSELVLTDFDLHLLAEGTHYRTYEKLGAHLREVNGVAGVHFAVWAPNASRVSVVGDFPPDTPARKPLPVTPELTALLTSAATLMQ